MGEKFELFPIGFVRKSGDITSIVIERAYTDALLGLGEFSHIIVVSWFHKNDRPEKRRVLQVHPRGDRSNPLTGVFATRSPVRPNLIALSTCKILNLENRIVRVDKIDAFDGTPVLDIKPCLSGNELMQDVRVPDWARRRSGGKGGGGARDADGSSCGRLKS